MRHPRSAVRWRARRFGGCLWHPLVVGDLDLAYDAMELPADPRQTLVAYTAEPGTPSEEKLSLLASWSATLGPARPETSGDRA